MSEILSNIVLEPITATFTPNVNSINFVPNAISLSVTTSVAANTGSSSDGQLIYNNNNSPAGVPNTVVSGGNLRFTNLPNLKINGGTANFYLKTDGAGNLSWGPGGNVTGNGTSAGANNDIQLGDGAGNFKVGTGFTFDTATSNLSVPGNASITGNLNVNNISFTSNISGSNISVTGNVSALYMDASIISATTFVGNISTANYANFAGNVTASSQPNITALGTLTGVTVDGTTSIKQALERVVFPSPSTGNINYDILSQAILQTTSNATGNFTLNFRGNSTVTFNNYMGTGNSTTCTYVNKNGSTAYFLQAVQVDGSTRTVNWLNGANPSLATATANGYDVYQFNFVKTGSNAYTIFGVTSGYK